MSVYDEIYNEAFNDELDKIASQDNDKRVRGFINKHKLNRSGDYKVSSREFPEGTTIFNIMDFSLNDKKVHSVDTKGVDVGLELGRLNLYDRVYTPVFDDAESLFDGVTSREQAQTIERKIGGNEYVAAYRAVNNHPDKKRLERKIGKKIHIVDMGPSEDAWKFALTDK